MNCAVEACTLKPRVMDCAAGCVIETRTLNTKVLNRAVKHAPLQPGTWIVQTIVRLRRAPLTLGT